MSENNMPIPENNMPSTEPFVPVTSGACVRYEHNVASEIILPLGTKFNTGPIANPDVAESKVLFGILGELEKLIFDLKDRVSKLEIYQAASAERIETLLSSIERKISGPSVFEIDC